MEQQPAEPVAPARSPAARPAPVIRRAGGFLGGLRVRKKVLFLHTLFSLGLAAVLLVPLRPAITDVVEQAEVNEARAVLRLVLSQIAVGKEPGDWTQLVPEGHVRSGSE